MLIVPLLPVPSQTLSIALDGQSFQIAVYILSASNNTAAALPDASSTEVTADSTQFTADTDNQVAQAATPQLYMDLSLNQTNAQGQSTQQSIINARPVMTGIPILIDAAYYGVVGEFAMVDISGADQPADYADLGSQFQLVYFEAADLLQAAA